MPFSKRYDFDKLINEAERLIIAELERQLDERNDGGICLCEDCVLDMAACAMNVVKPMYRTSLLGSLYASHALDEASYAQAIRSAVELSIRKVTENPSHD